MNVKDAPTGGGVYTDALVQGPVWDGTTITFSFPTLAQFTGYAGGEPTHNFEVLNATQQAAVRDILAAISSFTGLAFQEVTGSGAGSATLRFGMTDDTETAHAYLPSSDETGGDAWFRNTDGTYDSPTLGNYAWFTFMHEIGHALGLGHPHEATPEMPLDRDWMAYTIMSYRSTYGASLDGYTNGDWGFAQSFMMEDIAALQFLYGANFAFRNTNTTYTWNPATGEMSVNGVGQGAPGGNTIFMTVWDGGGTDTFDFSNYVWGVTIDLRPGSYTQLGTQTPILGGSAPGNIATALLYNGDPRSLIENAIGSNGDDEIHGNQAINALTGGAGNDELYGYDGGDILSGGADNDRLAGGNGADRLFGGVGSDILLGENGSDKLHGEDGNDVLSGGLGIDELNGGVGNDRLYGDEHADILNGGDGDDELDGGTGADQMIGGAGNDRYIVDNPGDQVIEEAGGGTDVVIASVSFVMSAHIEDASLAGSADANLTGNALNNFLRGNQGANIIDGGAGADIMLGGGGGDTYYVDDPADEVYDGNGPGIDTIYSSVSYVLADRNPYFDPYAGASVRPFSEGENHIDVLILTGSAHLSATGNKFDNTLIGNLGNNTLTGGDGNDVLDGGAGADTMIGGHGNDVYHVAQAGDVVIEAVAQGIDEVRTSLSAYTLGSHVENLTVTSGGAHTLIGNNLANTVTGGTGRDTVNGAAGDDTMIGGGGNDIYYVREAGDVVIEETGAGTDIIRTIVDYVLSAHVESLRVTTATGLTVSGNELDNLLVGNLGNDTIHGLAGNDTIQAGGGDDTVYGGEGKDVVWGVGGHDVLHGEAGNDLLRGNAGDDVLHGGDGNDTLVGNIDNDSLYGGAGNDGMLGGSGDDILDGGSGDDSIKGDAGNDIISGGAGRDSIYGGSGADTFVFDDGDSSADRTTADRLHDFSLAQGDKIDLSAIDANTNLVGDQAFTFIGDGAFSNTAGELRTVVIGSYTFVEGDTNGDGLADFSIRVPGTPAFAAADFVL